MLIIETVPLAITEGFDAGVVVATRSAPRMDHDGEQLKGQQTLRTDRRKKKSYCSDKIQVGFCWCGRVTDVDNSVTAAAVSLSYAGFAEE